MMVGGLSLFGLCAARCSESSCALCTNFTGTQAESGVKESRKQTVNDAPAAPNL